MKLFDFIILFLLLLWMAYALRAMLLNKKKTGSCTSCASCHGCSNRKLCKSSDKPK